MWKKKIKQKKMQFVLIGIILMLASVIFAISVSFTSVVAEYTKGYYNGNNVKDVMVITNNNDTYLKVKDYVKQNEKSEKDLRESESILVDKRVFFGDKNLDLSMTKLTKFEGRDKLPTDVIFIKGNDTKTPQDGEVWIASLLADSKDLSLGDKLRVKDGDSYRELKISALVNDSQYPSSVMGGNTLFVNAHDYNKFENGERSIALAYNTDKEYLESTADLISTVGDSLLVLDKGSLLFAANATSTMVSAVGICSAVLVFIASIVIIRFIIWNNILKEYKSIGVYKSLGYSSKQIRNIYLMSYGLVGVGSIVLGSLLSNLFTEYIVGISVKYIGDFESSSTSLNGILFIILTIILMSLVLIFSLYRLLKRVDKIKPVEAFRIGVTSSKEKFKKSLIKNAVSPIAMAINDIFKYKKQSVIILLVLSLAIYLSIFLVSINSSIINMDDNASNVFGIVKGDMSIDYPSGDPSYKDILDDLKKDSRIKSVRESSIDTGSVIFIDTNKYKMESAITAIIINESYENTDGFKISDGEGRNPVSKDEVAITTQISKDSGLKLGDYIEMKILGVEKKVLITGVYPSMMGGGSSIRMRLDSFPIDHNLLPNLAFNITLKDKESFKEVEKDYRDKYDACSIDTSPTLIKTSTASVVEVVKPVVTILVIGILLFSLLNIVNLVIMSNTDNRKPNAVMKSLGFSNNYIIKRTLYRMMILTSISGAIGFTINALTSRPLFEGAMMGIDLLVIPTGQVLILILGIITATLIATIAVMSTIKKISTIELMEE